MDDLDEILASGDDAAIEAALADMDTTGDVLFADEDEQVSDATPQVEPEPDVEAEPQTEKDVTEAEPSPPVEDNANTNYIEKDGKFYVEATDVSSKNGKHSLPYDVLQASRQAASAATAEREQLSQQNGELQKQLDELKRLNELHGQQLTDAKIDPKVLPEQMLKDPELMSRLKEDYPEIGDVVSALAAQVQQQTPQPQAAPAVEPTPIEQAFSKTAHLKGWRDSDVDRWELAQQIDNRLASDPSFADKPLTERLAEVEKRVMSAFGDELVTEQKTATPTPNVQPAKITAPIPTSPTDIGQQGSDASPNANLLDQDAGTMAAQMDSMSEAAIEALLEEASDFL